MLVKHPLKLPRGPVQFVTVDRNKALKTANLEAAATDMEPRVILMIFSLNSLQYKLHIRWWQNGQGWKAYPLSQETFKANFNFILLGTTIWIGKSSRHVRYKFLLSSLKHFSFSLNSCVKIDRIVSQVIFYLNPIPYVWAFSAKFQHDPLKRVLGYWTCAMTEEKELLTKKASYLYSKGAYESLCWKWV